MTDWKKKHDELAALTEKLRIKQSEIDFILSRIDYHLREADRDHLRDREVHRFLRLKETIQLAVQYDQDNREEPPQTYEVGTLIQAEIRGNIAHVYLDYEGDGHLYFPADKLETVEIPYDQFDSDKIKVIYQG